MKEFLKKIQFKIILRPLDEKQLEKKILEEFSEFFFLQAKRFLRIGSFPLDGRTVSPLEIYVIGRFFCLFTTLEKLSKYLSFNIRKIESVIHWFKAKI